MKYINPLLLLVGGAALCYDQTEVALGLVMVIVAVGQTVENIIRAVPE